MTRLGRRDFIKITAATAGAAAMAGSASRLLAGSASGPDARDAKGERVVPTFCEMCFWKCGVLAHVRDGVVTKLTGNPAHPLSRGKLCPRGIGGTGLLYDPDRLQRPLVRRERGGEQVFVPVSWDTALDLVAEKLQRLAQTHGPEALALFSHGFGGSWFKTLARAYGTPNIAAPGDAQCRGSRETAFRLTFGSGVGSPERVDLEHARVLALIGSHLGENMHNTQVQELAAAVERHADIIVVDPRFSTAAGKARWWLPIRPGTDVALLLAWMNVLLEEHRYDEAYVEANTVGLEELKAHVASRTPEWAWTVTGIEPERIRETARALAGARPAALVHPGRHTAWDGNDTQRGRAVAILNALLGSWGRRGGFFVPSTMPVPPVAHPPFPKPARPPADLPHDTVYPFAEDVLAHGLRDNSLPGPTGQPIRAWFVYGTNLLHSLPQPERTRDAIGHLDFLVAVDVLPAEITGYADVVLPEATYLERYDDLHTPGWKQGYVALRQPAIDPLFETRPGWWIARELARRLGLEAYFPWTDARDYLERRLEAAGHSLEEIERSGVLVAPKAPITYEEGVVPTFDTPSGKIELYVPAMAEAGLPPLPDYVPPVSLEADTFHLLYGRAPMHTFGRTTNNPLLTQVMRENVVWIHRERGIELGLETGQRVRLVNQDGVRSEPVAVRLTERIRRDCVYLVHGFGHRDRRLRLAYGRGAADSELITRTRIDPVMGGTGMNVNVVRIERAEA